MATPAVQRPYRGSRVSSFYSVKSLPPLSSLDSAFQLQEYISLLIRLDAHDVDTIIALPEKSSSKESDERPLDSPENDSKKPDDGERKSEFSVDRACWIYEQLRRLAQDLSHPLITMLQQECTRSSCPQMKAGEWLYLCVAHGNDGAMEQCCAIDYILHTLDSATGLLNSPRAFPSRLSIPQTSHRHFASLARRLGRIFAHAYFHHREVFEQAEAESSLYSRFLKLTSQFDLVPAEFLVIPEHHDGTGRDEEVEPPRLLAAAVHPPQNFHSNALTTEKAIPIIHANDGRGRSPTGIDNASHIGIDSPRRPGRSRTDTMVFSEGYNVAEELSKGEPVSEAHGGSPLSASVTVEPEPFASEQPWPENEMRTEEDLVDEDIDVARTESTTPGPVSPPVAELLLIPLEEPSDATLPSEPAVSNATEELIHLPQDPAPEASTVHEATPEELGEPAPAEPIESQPAEEPCVSTSTSDAAEVATQEEENADVSEPSPELSENPPPKQDEAPAGSSTEEDSSAPSSTDEDTEDAEQRREPEAPLPNEYLLDLSEPPPSEPIPPESESDITDEVNELDVDEVRESGGDGEVTGE